MCQLEQWFPWWMSKPFGWEKMSLWIALSVSSQPLSKWLIMQRSKLESLATSSTIVPALPPPWPPIVVYMASLCERVALSISGIAQLAYVCTWACRPHSSHIWNIDLDRTRRVLCDRSSPLKLWHRRVTTVSTPTPYWKILPYVHTPWLVFQHMLEAIGRVFLWPIQIVIRNINWES